MPADVVNVFFKKKVEQDGFTSFILLSGITINVAIYILKRIQPDPAHGGYFSDSFCHFIV
jgi:hypothetical protein